MRTGVRAGPTGRNGMNTPVHVVKLGGSLLDLPNLPDRLGTYLQTLGSAHVALLVGGGCAADLARQWDQLHHVGEEAGHWLAVRAMQFNMHLISRVLPNCRIAASPTAIRSAWDQTAIALIEPLEWVQMHDEQIPHRWTFTSDSIAAHVAVTLSADQLTLLKSALPGDARRIIDEEFKQASAEIVNLRAQPPATCVIGPSI